MGILSRTVFLEITSSAVLGTTLFIFVLFLQKLGRLFEIMVRSSAPLSTVGYLFTLVVPPTLTFAIPVGVLVGVLLGLNRMSSDGEIIGMRAGGLPTRRLLYPVVTFALLPGKPPLRSSPCCPSSPPGGAAHRRDSAARIRGVFPEQNSVRGRCHPRAGGPLAQRFHGRPHASRPAQQRRS